MNINLPLNRLTQALRQEITIPITFADYTTLGAPHGEITINVTLKDATVHVHFTIRAENRALIYNQKWAYQATELIPQHIRRRKPQ